MKFRAKYFFKERNQAENLHGIFCDSVGRFENQGRSGAQQEVSREERAVRSEE